jgi:hypothetical protein
MRQKLRDRVDMTAVKNTRWNGNEMEKESSQGSHLSQEQHALIETWPLEKSIEESSSEVKT